jgi:hypothetical protein
MAVQWAQQVQTTNSNLDIEALGQVQGINSSDPNALQEITQFGLDQPVRDALKSTVTAGAKSSSEAIRQAAAKLM